MVLFLYTLYLYNRVNLEKCAQSSQQPTLITPCADALMNTLYNFKLIIMKHDIIFITECISENIVNVNHCVTI